MARKYYYDTGEKTIGPVTGNELVQLRASGELSADTWVRRADSKTWRPLSGIDLREEEAEEANPSLLKLLWRHLSPGNIILIAAVAITLILLLASIATLAWPVLLVLFVLWILSRALR